MFIELSGLQERTKYLEGVKTIEDDEFQELLEDVDDLEEAVDEMVGEDEHQLTEGEAAKLKVALRALCDGKETEPNLESDAQPWDRLCDLLTQHEPGIVSAAKVGDAACRDLRVLY